MNADLMTLCGNQKILGIGLVLLSVCIEALGQVALKKAAISPKDSFLYKSASASGILLLAVEAVIWTMVLKLLDVSVAFPMGALSFVTTAIFSALLLRERIAVQRWLGIFTIVGGTALLSI